MNKKLIVVGGAGIFYDGEKGWVTKTPVAKYINELGETFGSVHWFSSEHKGDAVLSGFVDVNFVEVTPLKTGILGFIGNCLNVVKLLLFQRSCVLIYFPAALMVFPVLPIIRWRSKKMAVYLAGDFEVVLGTRGRDKWPGWKHIFRICIEYLLKKSDVVIARGCHLASLAKNYNSNVVETVPIANIPLDSYDKEKEFKSEKNIIYLGKLIATKGVGELLTAIKHLVDLKDGSVIKVDIVGDGADRAFFEKMSTTLNLDELCTFHGWVEDKNTLDLLFQRSDVLVVPSTSKQPEGVPRVIEEAMVRGVPVIATRVGGVTNEFVDEEICLINPDSVDEIVAAMQNMLFDEAVWNKFRNRTYERYEKWKNFGSPGKQHARLLLNGIGIN